MTPKRLAHEAEKLVGARFRLHGRDPANGLDCIGVLVAALAAGGGQADFPAGYPLRLSDISQWLPDPASLGFRAVTLPFRPGDVVLLQPGPAQFHLAIADRSGGWVHAHAGLRKVVRDDALPPGVLIHHWRLRPRKRAH